MPDGCIYHSRKPHPSGYVRVENPRGGTTGAHRLAYEVKYGKIPPSLIVCHKCDNPSCINTDHLFLGTSQDNSQEVRHNF